MNILCNHHPPQGAAHAPAPKAPAPCSPPPRREEQGALCNEHADGQDEGTFQKPMGFDGSRGMGFSECEAPEVLYPPYFANTFLFITDKSNT